jgi:predicted anti-sigma-YlaC factor YlaD
MVWRHAIGQVRVFEARLLDNVAPLTGSAWHKVAKLLLDGWVLSCVAILAILYTVIGSYRITRGADYLWYEAYGDPYGEYELNRAAGQPDIEK